MRAVVSMFVIDKMKSNTDTHCQIRKLTIVKRLTTLFPKINADLTRRIVDVINDSRLIPEPNDRNNNYSLILQPSIRVSQVRDVEIH